MRLRRPQRHRRRDRRPVRVSVVRDELELKSRVDNPEALRAALIASGAKLTYRGAMLDRRFDRKERLEKRDEVVRLRVFHPADRAGAWGVLGWKGPVSERGGYRHREEWESRVEDPKATLVVLRRLGYKVVVRVDRAVEVYQLDDATIRLEWYPAMDVLVEVEGPPEHIERAIAATGLPRESFLAESLPYFTAEYEKRTGRVARVSRTRPK
jgi:adenylate cyclase class IV